MTSSSDSGRPHRNWPASSPKRRPTSRVAGDEAAAGQGLAFPYLRPPVVVALVGLEAPGQGALAPFGPQRQVQLVQALHRGLAAHQPEEGLGHLLGLFAPGSCRRQKRPGHRGHWRTPAPPRRTGPWPRRPTPSGWVREAVGPSPPATVPRATSSTASANRASDRPVPATSSRPSTSRAWALQQLAPLQAGQPTPPFRRGPPRDGSPVPGVRGPPWPGAGAAHSRAKPAAQGGARSPRRIVGWSRAGGTGDGRPRETPGTGR